MLQIKNHIKNLYIPHLKKPDGIIRVSRKPISITPEDATNWEIPYKPYEEVDVSEPKWFKIFREHLDKRLSNIESNITQINNRLDNIESDVSEMKNTPTMKKELKLT